jgi:integrase
MIARNVTRRTILRATAAAATLADDAVLVALECRWRAACKRAGMNTGDRSVRFTPHSLRKACATRLALSGVSQRVLQANLGHAPGSRVTDQYCGYPAVVPCRC